jgi:hypothetical protein
MTTPPYEVADEDDRFALLVDDTLRHGNVVGVRDRRILDDTHAVAVLLQLVVDALPAGSVHEATVNKNDRPRC